MTATTKYTHEIMNDRTFRMMPIYFTEAEVIRFLTTHDAADYSVWPMSSGGTCISGSEWIKEHTEANAQEAK